MSTLQTTDEVLFTTLNNAGIITLNRPKSLNAISVSIVHNLLPKLWEWENEKRLVIIKGNGRAFCAGGDIKKVSDNGGGSENNDLVLYEYNINYLIGTYRIPYIAFMDGVTMGGGMGLSVHGRYRVATENTVVAMPETKIALVPDVGASYFLSRLPFHLGIYFGLTSDVLKGKEVAAIGIATHFVSSHRLPELESELTKCISNVDVEDTLNKFHEPVGKWFSLSTHVKDIDYCFSATTVEEIISRLLSINNDWSMGVIKTLRQRCPLALKLSLKSLNLGAHLTLWQSLEMENRLILRLTTNYNFYEGVRALLIDKDNNPQWIPKTVEEVKDSDIEPFFAPLPQYELAYLKPNSKL